MTFTIDNWFEYFKDPRVEYLAENPHGQAWDPAKTTKRWRIKQLDPDAVEYVFHSPIRNGNRIVFKTFLMTPEEAVAVNVRPAAPPLNTEGAEIRSTAGEVPFPVRAIAPDEAIGMDFMGRLFPLGAGGSGAVAVDGFKESDRRQLQNIALKLGVV